MKKNIAKTSFAFVFLLTMALALCFGVSAKEVKSGAFTFNVGKSSATLLSYEGKDENVKIPSKVKNVPVTKIGSYAFSEVKKMKTVSIPQTVTAMGEAVFNNCPSLQRVDLPKGLKKIPNAAFWYCTELSKLFVYDKVTSIGNNAFAGCGKLTVYVVKGSYAEKYISEKTNIKMGYRYITSLKMEKSALDIETGKTTVLKVKAAPASSYNKNVTYKSSNEKVASVSQNGTVTAVAPGKAVITATAKDGSQKVTSCSVRVLPQKISAVKYQSLSLNSYKIYWTKAKGAEGYQISKYDTKKKEWVILKKTTKNTITITSADPFDVRYRIIAYKSVGSKNYYSPSYSYITARPLTVENVTDLKVEAVGSYSVSLSWKEIKSASSYDIYLYKNDTKSYMKLLSSDKNSVTLSNLAPNSEYTFSVKGVFKGNEIYYSKDFSESVKAKTLPGKITDFALKDSELSYNKATLTWSKVPGADGYVIYQYDKNEKKYKEIKIISNKNTTSLKLDNLMENTEYSLKIRPFRTTADNLGDFSDELKFKTKSKSLERDTAFETFVTTLNSFKKSSKTFSLTQSCKVTNRIAPFAEEYESVLDSITSTYTKNHTVILGKDISTGKGISSLLPPFERDSALSEEMIDQNSIVFAEDGSGHSISFSLKKDTTGEYNREIISLIDWERVKEENPDFNLKSCTYEKTAVTTKIIADEFSYLIISVPLRVEFAMGEKSYSFSETIEYKYFFT